MPRSGICAYKMPRAAKSTCYPYHREQQQCRGQKLLPKQCWTASLQIRQAWQSTGLKPYIVWHMAMSYVASLQLPGDVSSSFSAGIS